MESENESFSGDKLCIRTRLSDGMGTISSKLRSFWMSFGCLFQFDCFYQSVEVQTEEDVARFIAMSLKAAKNGQIPEGDNKDFGRSAECGGAGVAASAAETRESLNRTRFTNLLDNFNDGDAINEGHAISRQSRSTDVEKRHGARNISFVSSLAHENIAESGQRHFHNAYADKRASPFGEKVSLVTSKACNRSLQEDNAMNPASGSNLVPGWKYIEENGSIHAIAADSGEFHQALSAEVKACQDVFLIKRRGTYGEDCKPFESKPGGEANDSGKEVACFLCMKPTSELDESRWNDELVMTVQMEAESQAKVDIARCAANQTDSVCKALQTEIGTQVVEATSCDSGNGHRERRKISRWMRKLFCGRVWNRNRQVISV